MENLNKSKYSFWGLLEKFNKIEIPILQRDYAHGRIDSKTTEIRNKFLDSILNHIEEGKSMELDFVYGTEEGDKVFIPLDGQQRLTTLFLLHWYLANSDDEINGNIKIQLSKFSYETRPSSNDFCHDLVMKGGICSTKSLILNEIKNASWYHFAWDNDPTIQSMLVVLEEIHKRFQKIKGRFSEIKESSLITFYFLNLERFGLTDSLYIKMNARGKELTPFENFKTDFEIILDPFPNMLDDFKDRIEGLWLDNFWPYRSKDHTTDKVFMRYLYFISEMIYFQKGLNETNTTSPFEYYKNKDGEFGYKDNLKLLESCYQEEDNIRKLFFALDNVKELNEDDSVVFGNWGGDKYNSCNNVTSILKAIIEPTQIPSIEQKLILYAIITYSYNDGKATDKFDFIRVIRNLIHNSDLEYRFFQNQIKSIEKLIGENVYQILLKEDIFKELLGFKEDQRKEEIFKAKLVSISSFRKEIFYAEDTKRLEGNISCLLNACYASNKADIKGIDLAKVNPVEFNASKFADLTDSYLKLSEDNFESLIGDLFTTEVYQYNGHRLILSSAYLKHAGTIELVFEKAKEINKDLTIKAFAEKIEKIYISDLEKHYDDFSQIRDVRIQLYLYYILTRRIQKKEFVKGKRWNFGWLTKKTGYTSIFSAGIEGSPYWNTCDYNPIFQYYGSQFRFTLGLNDDRTIPMERTKSGDRPQNPFERLKIWAADS